LNPSERSAKLLRLAGDFSKESDFGVSHILNEFSPFAEPFLNRFLNRVGLVGGVDFGLGVVRGSHFCNVDKNHFKFLLSLSVWV